MASTIMGVELFVLEPHVGAGPDCMPTKEKSHRGAHVRFDRLNGVGDDLE